MRWIRAEPEELHQFPGIGIQFIELDGTQVPELEDILDRLCTTAYIPDS